MYKKRISRTSKKRRISGQIAGEGTLDCPFDEHPSLSLNLEQLLAWYYASTIWFELKKKAQRPSIGKDGKILIPGNQTIWETYNLFFKPFVSKYDTFDDTTQDMITKFIKSIGECPIKNLISDKAVAYCKDTQKILGYQYAYKNSPTFMNKSIAELYSSAEKGQILLSYSWGYKLKDIIDALMSYELFNHEFYMCWASINQPCLKDVPIASDTFATSINLLNKRPVDETPFILISLTILTTITREKSKEDIFSAQNLTRFWCIFELMYAWLICNKSLKRIKFVIYHQTHRVSFEKHKIKIKKWLNDLPGSTTNPIGVWLAMDNDTIRRDISALGGDEFPILFREFKQAMRTHLWVQLLNEYPPADKSVSQDLVVIVEETTGKY